MSKYKNIVTGQELSWSELKKFLNASIPYSTEQIGDWVLQPIPEPPAQFIPSEPAVSLEERIADLEDAVIELASIIEGGNNG